jgi:hypothetical protein
VFRTALTNATGLLTMLLCIFGRFAVAFPVCFCIYAWAWAAPVCFGHGRHSCIVDSMMAPFILAVGPIAHEDEDYPNYYLHILVATAVVVVVWTTVALVRRHQRA